MNLQEIITDIHIWLKRRELSGTLVKAVTAFGINLTTGRKLLYQGATGQRGLDVATGS